MMSIEQSVEAAVTARECGRFDDAIEILQVALVSARDDYRLWQTLGTVRRAELESDLALSAFECAARLAPTSVRCLHGVAQAALEGGHPSVDHFKRARHLAPDDGALIVGEAAARLADVSLEDAIAFLAPIAESNPAWYLGQSTLARLLRSAGIEQDIALKRAILRLPLDPSLRALQIDLALDAGEFEAAVGHIASARLVLSNSHLFLLQEAAANSELGRLEQAETAFAELGDRTTPAVSDRWVRHLLRCGRMTEAVAFALPLAQAGQRHLWPYLSLAWRATSDQRAQWLDGVGAMLGEFDLHASVDLPALATRLRTLHRTVASPLGQSVHGGTQTDGPLLAHASPEIVALKHALRTAVGRYVETLPPEDCDHPTLAFARRRWRWGGSWSVRLAGYGYHHNHVHPYGWLSCSFYVVVPNTSNGSEEGQLVLGEGPEELQMPVSATASVRPAPGKVAVFPALAWHGTRPFPQGERLTVAFDIIAC